MMVAGVGCRRGASAEMIEQALERAAAACGVDPYCIAALATERSKGTEPGIVAAAARRGLPLRLVDVRELRRMASRVATRSDRVQSAKGVPSIAEAAALAAAGADARLLGARVANAVATCAIALGADA